MRFLGGSIYRARFEQAQATLDLSGRNPTLAGSAKVESVSIHTPDDFPKPRPRPRLLRVSVVKLTDQGKALVNHFEAVLETRLNRLVADWPSYRRDAIADALARLVETIHDDIAYEASIS